MSQTPQIKNLLSNILPHPYIQNKDNWCWAVCAKIIGQHICDQCNPVSADSHRQETSVPVENQQGLRHAFVRYDGSQCYVDSYQRAIVMGANTHIPGSDGNFSEGDIGKARALKYVITGDADSLDVIVRTIGCYRDARTLLEQYEKPMQQIIAARNWLIGNFVIYGRHSAHSVVLIPESDHRLWLYDPWDGFADTYTLRQIFCTGFLTSMGHGIVKWIQYVE